MRPAGKTYIHLLRAVERACSRPGSECIIIFSGQPSMEQAMRQLGDIVSCIRDFIEFKPKFFVLNFKNGSQIRFKSVEWVGTRGDDYTSYDYVEEDHSVEDFRTGPRYLENLSLLKARATIKRNRK